MSASHRSLPQTILFLTIAVLLVSLLAGACANSSEDEAADAESAGVAGEPAAEVGQVVAGGQAEESDQAKAAGATTGSGASAVEAQPAGVPDLVVAQDWDRMIVRTASVALSVADGSGVGSAVNWVRDLATGKGGLVQSSNTYSQDDQQYAEITIQVPVDQFDATMNELRTASFVDEVLREESSSQDVTAEYVDNESRLKALQETYARFLELLGQAQSVDEILRLEYELSNVRQQIETIQGRQNYLERITAFSTISVTLNPSGAPAPIDPDPGFSLARIFERAWEHSRGAIEDGMIALITIAIFSAAFLPFALVAFLGYRFVRSRSTRAAEVRTP